MEPQKQLPEDHPLMIAWKSYRATEEFANTIRRAGENNLGSLWTAFASGWGAAPKDRSEVLFRKDHPNRSWNAAAKWERDQYREDAKKAPL